MPDQVICSHPSMLVCAQMQAGFQGIGGDLADIPATSVLVRQL